MSTSNAVKARVLVAHHQDGIRQTIAITLGDETFDVELASNSEEALILTRSFRPHVAVVDVDLADPTGFEVCRRIKSDPVLKTTKLVLLVATARTLEKTALSASGADDTLRTPFGPLALINKIHALLGWNPILP